MTPIRQPTGTAFALRDPLPWEAFARLAREGEALGYRAVFLPEIAGRDAFAALTGLAGETTSLFLGTGIVPMASRDPRLTSMGAATVQERSSGRAILGIGVGGATRGALERLEAYVAAVRAGLSGGRVKNGGDAPPFRLSLVPEAPVPVWISALGPRATALAGGIADGVLLNWCSPERVTKARASVRAAAEAAGRDPDAVTIAVYVRGCPVDDGAAALEALRAATGEYASYPSYARQFTAMGLGSETEAAAAAHRAGRPQDVPEALVRAVCLPEDPARARERLDEYHEAGADLPVVYPVAMPGPEQTGSIERTLRTLAPAV